MSAYVNISLEDFRQAHPEELGADGKLRVCVGGGAGFIGSHIAKRLRAEVRVIIRTIAKYHYNCISFHRDAT